MIRVWLLRPRWTFLLDAGMLHHAYGAMILACGLLLLVPVPLPLSNGLPALTVVLLAAAMLERDGYFVLAGLVVFAWRPHHPASHGLLSVGLIGGLFAITGADLYGPHWFFRLHVLTEAMVPASLLHLALVFPTHRLQGARLLLLLGVYAACGVLAVAYEALLYRPMAYRAVHLLATTAQGAGGLVLIATITYDLLTTTSALVRRGALRGAAAGGGGGGGAMSREQGPPLGMRPAASGASRRHPTASSGNERVEAAPLA